MAGKKYTKTRMNPNTVLRIYKMMKRNPNKVWVRSDFTSDWKKGYWILENSMNLLIHLGLVRVVPAVYYCGVKMLTRRDTKGFKLNLTNEK